MNKAWALQQTVVECLKGRRVVFLVKDEEDQVALCAQLRTSVALSFVLSSQPFAVRFAEGGSVEFQVMPGFIREFTGVVFRIAPVSAGQEMWERTEVVNHTEGVEPPSRFERDVFDD